MGLGSAKCRCPGAKGRCVLLHAAAPGTTANLLRVSGNWDTQIQSRNRGSRGSTPDKASLALRATILDDHSHRNSRTHSTCWQCPAATPLRHFPCGYRDGRPISGLPSRARSMAAALSVGLRLEPSGAGGQESLLKRASRCGRVQMRDNAPVLFENSECIGPESLGVRRWAFVVRSAARL